MKCNNNENMKDNDEIVMKIIMIWNNESMW